MLCKVIAVPFAKFILEYALDVCPGFIAAGSGEVENGCTPAVFASTSVWRFIVVAAICLFPEFFSVMERYSSPFELLMSWTFSTDTTPLSDATFDAELYALYPPRPAATATPMRIRVVIAGAMPRLLTKRLVIG